MTRPPHPKYDRNKNILIVGGSGAGKTRGFVKPSIMQMNASFVVTDPKGTVLVEVGKMLQKGGFDYDKNGNRIPLKDKNGNPLKSKNGKQLYKRTPYQIKVFNTINFDKSLHYNPFAYIHTEQDVLKFVNTLIANTKGEGAQSGEDFWVKAERLLFTAYVSYIITELEEDERNFVSLLAMIDASETREDDENFKNPIDLMFDDVEKEKPDSFCLRQYRKYKLAAGVVCSKRLLNQAVGKSLRTHNLKPKKGAQVMRKNEKITALYERLIRDDFGKEIGRASCRERV